MYTLSDWSRDRDGTYVHSNRIGIELRRTGTAACGNGWERDWKTSPVQHASASED